MGVICQVLSGIKIKCRRMEKASKNVWLHQIQMYYLSSCFDPSALEDGLNFAAGLGEAGRCLVDGFLAIEADVEMGFGVEMDKEEEMGLLASSWHGLLFSWDTSFDSFLKAR